MAQFQAGAGELKRYFGGSQAFKALAPALNPEACGFWGQQRGLGGALIPCSSDRPGTVAHTRPLTLGWGWNAEHQPGCFSWRQWQFRQLWEPGSGHSSQLYSLWGTCLDPSAP